MLGGARSGKSVYAERLAENAGPDRVYVATARAWDDEMQERIAAHRARRGDGWSTLEAPEHVTDALEKTAEPGRAILVDCLTLWITNLMMAEADVDDAGDELVALLPSLTGTTVLVSNEVGLGIVPENAMARRFRDHAGRLHQRIAAVADEVVLVAAGLPLKLKG